MTQSESFAKQYGIMCEWMNGIVDAFSEEDFRISASPGKNHALWILCHMIASDDDFSLYLGRGGLLYPEYAEQFTTGKPLIPFEECPTPSDAKSALRQVIHKNIKIYDSLDDSELDEPHSMLKEGDEDFFGSKRRVIIYWQYHQIYHTGQLAMLLGTTGRRVYG